MLGEAALTESDAQEFFVAYENSIKVLSENIRSDDIRLNPGISVKLSAVYR
jgi:RHH-type proline utilization regulon transcriptional repressor/proline dehydrogenase/delta 1-pyrroline-5-carboxylate dehydrogenase